MWRNKDDLESNEPLIAKVLDFVRTHTDGENPSKRDYRDAFWA